MLRLPHHSLTLLPLLALLVTGCAPQTLYRRTALVPATQTETLARQPRGSLEATGGVSFADHDRDRYPDVGDPAVLRPTVQVHGQLRFRAGRFLYLGAQANYAHAGRSQESATATPPLSRSQSYIGAGPNASMHFDIAPRTTLSLATAFTFGVMPWTAYERIAPPSQSGEESQFDPSEHRVADEGRDTLLLGRFSLGFSHRLTRWFDINYGVSVQNAAYNIGFDNVPREGSTLSADSFGAVPWVAVNFHAPNGMLFGAAYSIPIGFGHYDSGPGSGNFQLTIGVDWGPGAQLHERG